MSYEIIRWRWPGRQMKANVSRAFLGRSSFYLLVDFFSPPHIKLPKRVKGHCVNKPVSEGLGSISICPCFAAYVFFSVCVHCRRRSPSPLGACFFVFLFGARADFSTRELSPQRQMWHALRSWRGWLAWDEHERERRSAYLWRRCT